MKSSTSAKGLAAIAAGILVIALLWTLAAELFFEKQYVNINRPKLEESIILLPTEDVQETIDFYKNVFAEQNIVINSNENSTEFASINIDNVKFLIYSRKEFKNKNNSDLLNYIDSSYREHFIYSSNIDSLYKLIENNVEVISSPNISIHNLRSFSIEDINGYILTFLEKRITQ